MLSCCTTTLTVTLYDVVKLTKSDERVILTVIIELHCGP